MLHTKAYKVTDSDAVKELIRKNPWATFVSSTSTGLVASHYPILLDESADDIVIVSHFGRPDDAQHELGEHEMLVIVQGPHDYVSASLYDDGEIIPTWDHLTAHLYGKPEALEFEDNYAMLERLTEHFEQHYPGGHRLSEDEAGSRKVARGTVGLRMRVDRFQAVAKLSQDKNLATRERIMAHIAEHSPELAAGMRAALRPEAT